MGIPTRNSHQSIEKVDYHIEPKCEKIPPLGDMFSPFCTTPVFIDRTHVKASLSNPHTCVCP
jgi:hypothetical protein